MNFPTAIFRFLALYRSLLPSQILSYDHNIMSLHFRTLHTLTEHVFANLVCVFSVSRSVFFSQLFTLCWPEMSRKACIHLNVNVNLNVVHICFASQNFRMLLRVKSARMKCMAALLLLLVTLVVFASPPSGSITHSQNFHTQKIARQKTTRFKTSVITAMATICLFCR